MLPPDFALAVEAYHRALEAYVAGDADPVLRLFSRRDDVTLANPLGPPVRGWAQVEEAARRAGAQVRDGADNRFEPIAAFAAADLGYVVEVHRGRANLGGGTERTPFALRITTVFRRERGVANRPPPRRPDHRPTAHRLGRGAVDRTPRLAAPEGKPG